MASPEFHVTPGYGERNMEPYHLVQAVRIGQQVEISGQAGFAEDGSISSDLDKEIGVAFDNVRRTLETAGATWADVYKVVSYHVPTPGVSGLHDHIPIMVELMRKYMPDQPPLWTCLGVACLGEPQMHIEIEVLAHVGDR